MFITITSYPMATDGYFALVHDWTAPPGFVAYVFYGTWP
jgi:hypothetical protein